MTDREDLIAALEPLVRRVRTDVTAKKGPNGQTWTREELTQELLLRHVNGGPARGVCPIKAGESTTMVGLLDLDSHKGESTWQEMADTASQVLDELARRGLHAVPFRSSGGKGVHLYVLWDEPQDARSVRHALREAIGALGFKHGTGGVKAKHIEVFPKQDHVPEDGFGNQFVLPLAGASEPLNPLDLEPMGKDAAVGMHWPSSEPVAFVEPPNNNININSAQTVFEDLKQLERALWSIPNDIDDRDEWFRLMCAFKEGGGDKEVARAWTMQHPSYRDEAFEGPWESITIGKEDGTPVDYLIRVAESHGWNELKIAEFENIEDVSSTHAPAPTAGPLRFQVLPANEFANQAPPRWIIKHVLPQAELVVLYGASGSGKSFMALDMAGAIARGTTWRGKKVRQGKVVYIAAEGAGGFRNRMQAYAQHNQVDLAELNIGVIHAAPNLLEAQDAKDVITAIKASGGADVVIIDTFAQTTPGANENAGEDMGKALGHCKRIHAATGAVVVLVHHSGKDASKGARGWSGLRAAADAELEVVRVTDRARMLRLSKQKDGEDELSWGFELDVVQIGVDEDIEPITSCVVAEAAVPAGGGPTKPLSKNQKIVAEVMSEIAESQTAGIEVGFVVTEVAKRMMVRDGVDADQKGNFKSRARTALNALCNGEDALYELDLETNTVEIL
jgi:energy-coupling factor transporter ATP-binding protein EcfA2